MKVKEPGSVVWTINHDGTEIRAWLVDDAGTLGELPGSVAMDYRYGGNKILGNKEDA